MEIEGLPRLKLKDLARGRVNTTQLLPPAVLSQGKSNYPHQVEAYPILSFSLLLQNLYIQATLDSTQHIPAPAHM